MLILALQTAADPAQIALLDTYRPIVEYTIQDRYSVCRELAPEIERILTQTGHTATDIDLIAVCSGPGSFTGIRIGIAAAKALAHALERPLVSVDSLRALAHGVPARCIVSCIGAGRDTVFCGAYSEKGESLRDPVMIPYSHLKTWISDIPDPGEYVIVGHACPRLPELAGELDMQVIERSATATAIGALGIDEFNNGNIKDSLKLAPFYLRLSSPEERIARLEG